MAGEWTELQGTRRVERNLRERDTIVTVYADAASTRPTLGQAYVDVVIAGQAGLAPDATNLAHPPELVQMSAAYRATPTKTHITVRFRAPYAES